MLQKIDFMGRSFLFNIAFMLIINFLVKPFWVFGIDRTVQNELGSETFGYFFAIYNFSYLFQILLDFGLQNFNNTEIASHPERMKTLFPGLVTTKAFFAVLYLMVTVVFAVSLGYHTADFFPWLLLNQILLSLIIFLRSNVSAHRKFIQDALLSVMDKMLMIVFCSVLLWGQTDIILTVKHYLQAQTLALVFTALACAIAILKIESNFVWSWNVAIISKIIKESLPFAVTYFLMTIYYRVDTVMIEQFADNGAYEAGIYAQGYRIMESVNNLGYLVAGILLPLFSYHLSRKKSIFLELRHGIGLMATMSIPIIITGYAYAENIIGTLYRDGDVAKSTVVFRFLLLNFFPVAMLYVIGTLLTAGKFFRWMIPNMILAVILNAVLNYIFIITEGAPGAAKATLLTQLYMLIAYSAGILYYFKMPLPWKLALRFFVFIGLMLTGIFVCKQMNLDWWWGVLVNGIVALPFAMLSGVLKKEAFTLKIQADENASTL